MKLLLSLSFSVVFSYEIMSKKIIPVSIIVAIFSGACRTHILIFLFYKMSLHGGIIYCGIICHLQLFAMYYVIIQC